jgi:hypothetical protein
LYFGTGVGGLLSLEYTLLSKYVATLPSVQAFDNHLADQALAFVPGLESGLHNFDQNFASFVTRIEAAIQNLINPPPPTPTTPAPSTFDPDDDGDDDGGVAGY